jgi:hypothetical protein
VSELRLSYVRGLIGAMIVVGIAIVLVCFRLDFIWPTGANWIASLLTAIMVVMMLSGVLVVLTAIATFMMTYPVYCALHECKYIHAWAWWVVCTCVGLLSGGGLMYLLRWLFIEWLFSQMGVRGGRL